MTDAPTGTFQTYSANANREDLQDFIANISPTDNPWKSRIGETEATNVKHEWPQDSLAAASTTNAQVEGGDFPGSTSAAPSRIINYCQIFSKDITVSRTQRKMNHAGISDFYDYQVMKKGREIMRDIEATISQNIGYEAGDATTARKLRAMESWLSTNTSLNDTSASGAGATVTTASTGSAGTDSTAATLARSDATYLRAMTEAMLKTVIQSVYTQGGSPTYLSVGPYNKGVVSAFTGRTSATENVNVGTIQQAAHVYASDFGDIQVIPNRYQRERSAFVLDPEYLAIAYFDRLQEDPQGKAGDGSKTLLVTELTLQVGDEAAHGGIFDLKTSA